MIVIVIALWVDLRQKVLILMNTEFEVHLSKLGGVGGKRRASGRKRINHQSATDFQPQRYLHNSPEHYALCL